MNSISEFSAALRVALYLTMAFLILFDLPVIKTREHKLVLYAMATWILVVAASQMCFAIGLIGPYIFLRDYGNTGTALFVILAHLYWLNRRNKDDAK